MANHEQRASRFICRIGKSQRACRALRHQYRVKQEQLAERLGVDVATISRYERGERAMSVGTLLQIADQFSMPASTLLPPEHQLRAPELSPPAQSSATEAGTLLAGLPQFEAGAIKSIIQVLATRPELIVPVMTAIEQYAEGEAKQINQASSSDT